MSLLTRLPLLATAALGTVMFAGSAHAQAFYLQEQSARGAGRAFSGEGADTGAASLWWNPAAIANIDRTEITVAASMVRPHGNVADHGTLIVRPASAPALVGGDPIARNPISNGVIPSGAIAIPLGRNLAFGLAVTSPYSFTTDYAATSWSRYSALRTKLLTIDIQPSIAFAPTDWLRIGAGPNIEYADATLSNALPNLSALLPDGQQALKGHGWDLGWTAGVQLHNDFATVGITYKSRIEHTLNGQIDVTGLVGPLAGQNMSLSGVKARYTTPAQVIVGARFNVTNRLTLNAQAVAYQWSRFDAITLGAPVNSAIPENYRDSWSLAGGVDYALSPVVTVRAGVQRAVTPTQDGLRDARVPDSDRWNFGVGLTANVSKHFAVDAAANYVDFANAPIDRTTAAYYGTPAQTVVLTNGELHDANAVVLSLGGHFTF
jgi:long-chain fatty acid transport protein